MLELCQASAGQREAVAERLSSKYAGRFPRGFSVKSLMNLYRDYKAHGLEAVLLDYGQADEKPKAFLDELARRVEKNRRVASVELEAITADWLAGKDIPGYGTWQQSWARDMEGEEIPEHCPEWFTPRGWSERNLRRKLPGRAALEFARRGEFAAHSFLPQKRNDYRSLRPLEIVVFDDVRMDFLVSYPGHAAPVEMWLLVAMDAASRRIVAWLSLAAVPDEEGARAELSSASCADARRSRAFARHHAVYFNRARHRRLFRHDARR